jgi:urea transport system ATP-binding protein
MRTRARVLVTHQRQYLSRCDRVLVIENGRFVHDTPRDGIDEAKVSRFLSV